MSYLATHIFTTYARGLFCGVGAVIALLGLFGLIESMRWATVQADRLANFVIGGLLLLTGFLLFYCNIR